MNGLIMAAQLILGLSILVVLHELGHYLAARAFGIRVEKFYLFFDAFKFKLFSFKKGDTEYGIGWLPLGGYVKISGMVDESLDREQLKKEPQPWEFRSKPAWQRLIVMLGGVTVNAILGVILFAFVLLHYNRAYLPNDSVKDGIYAYELGRKAGFLPGDKILSVEGRKVERFKDILSTKAFFGTDIMVQRGQDTVHIEVPKDFYRMLSASPGARIIGPENYRFAVDSVVPDLNAAAAGLLAGDSILMLDSLNVSSWGAFSEMIQGKKGETVEMMIRRDTALLSLQVTVDSSGIIGFYARSQEYETKPYHVGSAIRYGFKDAMDILTANIKGFGKILSGKEKASESLQGPIGIAQIYGSIWDWSRFWFITGLLSLILAFMNILPIPALDGGHVIFLTIEAITGRKFSDSFMEKAQLAGMIILLGLMAFAIGNDIFKLFK